jgi:hypothetical protein
MQLSPTIAQPPALSAASNSPLGSGLLRLSTILRTPPISADQAAPAPSEQQQAVDAAAAASAPAADANLATKLFGNVGTTQQRYLENQQVIGLISQALGDRISQIGSQAWAMLRGTKVDG